MQMATFVRKTDARRWGQQTEAALREGRYFQASEARKHTLAELVDRYSREVLAGKPVGRRRDQERHLAWWRARLGAYLLADVSPALLAEERARLARGARSAGTVNRYLGSLSHVFSVAAREWGWVRENPLQ